jgi:multidrug efflux pump
VFPMLQNEYVKILKWTLSRDLISPVLPWLRIRKFNVHRLQIPIPWPRLKKFSISHKVFMIEASFALLLFVIILFGLFNQGVEFFPTTEPPQVSIVIETPSGTSLDVTNEISQVLEDRLQQIPGRKDVEYIATSIGTSDDVFDMGGQGTSNKGRIAINFLEKKLRDQNTFKTVEEVRKTIIGIAGADLRIAKQQMGPPVGSPVNIEISGEDYSTLASLSKMIRGKIKDVKGLVDLKDDYNTGRPEVEIIIDREKAGLFYTSTGQIASTVRAAIAGVEASKYRVGEDEYKIRVRLQEDQRTSPADLENLHITFMNRRGQLLSIPLTSVADIKRTTAVTDIRRKDQKRVITVSGDVEGRVQSEVINDVKARIAGVDFPDGYGIKLTGSQEEQQKATKFLFTAFIYTLLLVFLIMVAEFNSLKVPFVIMISVVLSLIGVMLGLLITFTPASVIMTGVGVVALAGLVVRNGIVLLDFVKHKHGEGGMSLDDALLEAGRIRLRPVVLTAVATILGVLPMATGFDFNWSEFHFVIGAESAEFWRPLAVTIIFGLAISTFLTLIVLPTIYSLFDDWWMKFKQWWVRIIEWLKKMLNIEDID